MQVADGNGPREQRNAQSALFAFEQGDSGFAPDRRAVRRFR
jgi:hypothetical protein